MRQRYGLVQFWCRTWLFLRKHQCLANMTTSLGLWDLRLLTILIGSGTIVAMHIGMWLETGWIFYSFIDLDLLPTRCCSL